MPELNPTPGSAEESSSFSRLQKGFPDVYREVFSDPKKPRTVIVVPSMSLEASELAKIPGVMHYEERMLCLLMLLRLPRAQLIYATSLPLDPAVVDYYLHLLPGVPAMHALERLKLFTVNDASLTPLSEKILRSPDRLAELKAAIAYPQAAHMTCFNASHLEKSLAVQLDVPMYASDPALSELGNKSRSREIFRNVGLDVPAGFEDLRYRGDLVDALTGLAREEPTLKRAVVKLNDGFSGEGNALIDLTGLLEAASPEKEAERRLTSELKFEAPEERWETYEAKMEKMGGIVEAFIEHPDRVSPSVQMRIDPLGEVQVVSTHDQVLAGPSGQVFMGCKFPADLSYRLDLHAAGKAVAVELDQRGVMGRFGVDFVSVPDTAGWNHYAIEINLRKGGTTLPFLMLEYLTDGRYDPDTGEFTTPTGDTRCYYATDNLVKPAYYGLTPSQLIDIAVYEGIHFHATSQQGLVFHLLGSVTDHGKIGLVSIAPTLDAAEEQYHEAVATLDQATSG